MSTSQATARDYKLPVATRNISADAAASTADLDYSATPLYNVFVGGVGSIWIKRPNDTAFVEYACQAGSQIFGVIVAIANTGSRAITATKVVGELLA